MRRPAKFEQAHRHEEAAKQHVVKDGKGEEGSERYGAENKDRRLTSNVKTNGVCNGDGERNKISKEARPEIKANSRRAKGNLITWHGMAPSFITTPGCGPASSL